MCSSTRAVSGVTRQHQQTVAFAVAQIRHESHFEQILEPRGIACLAEEQIPLPADGFRRPIQARLSPV